MKKCILVWQIPVVEGEYYNPIMYAIYIRKAKKFVGVLNEYFEKQSMNWICVLDKSACIYNEIFSSQYQAVFRDLCSCRNFIIHTGGTQGLEFVW